MEDKRIPYKVLEGKPKIKRPRRKLRCRWKIL